MLNPTFEPCGDMSVLFPLLCDILRIEFVSLIFDGFLNDASANCGEASVCARLRGLGCLNESYRLCALLDLALSIV